MDKDTALFFTMIYQYNELAMISMGKLPGPDGKIQPVNNEATRYAIDFLEMIEHKTKGNLNEDEQRMLTQTLTNLRLNFLEELKKKEPTAPPDTTHE